MRETSSLVKYLSRIDGFLSKISKSEKLDTNKETSILTTKLINDIVEKGSKK